MRERARRERCPPDSSVSDSFHTSPNATRTSSPAKEGNQGSGLPWHHIDSSMHTMPAWHTSSTACLALFAPCFTITSAPQQSTAASLQGCPRSNTPLPNPVLHACACETGVPEGSGETMMPRTVQEGAVLGRLQLGRGARQQHGEDRPKVLCSAATASVRDHHVRPPALRVTDM